MIETDQIIDIGLWARIKAKFGFPGQFAKKVYFRNECILIQNVADFMNVPEISSYGFATLDLGLNQFLEVGKNERFRIRMIYFNSPDGEIDYLKMYNLGAETGIIIDSFTATDTHVSSFETPLILDPEWTIYANVTTVGTFSVTVYYEKEVVG